MLQPNDLPLVCLPTELNGEAAAKLLEFLYELTEAIERHYTGQLHAYRHPQEYQRDLRFAAEHLDSDPPF